MSMSFGGGDPYGALVQAMEQRRQRMAQQAPQQQPMQPLGGTMELRVPQMPQAGGAAPQTAAGGFASGMSALSMAEMLKRMRNDKGGQFSFEKARGNMFGFNPADGGVKILPEPAPYMP